MVSVAELSGDQIRWIILFEGMLTRVYKFDNLVAQMLAYTSSSRQNEFMIMSRILRESSARANQAVSDAHAETGAPQSRRPDYATMMADIASRLFRGSGPSTNACTSGTRDSTQTAGQRTKVCQFSANTGSAKIAGQS